MTRKAYWWQIWLVIGFGSCLASSAVLAQSNLKITVLQNAKFGERASLEQQAIQIARSNFDLAMYAQVRVAVMGEKDQRYLLVQLLSKTTHGVDFVRVSIGTNAQVLETFRNYAITDQDFAGLKTLTPVEPRCPNNRLQFLVIAPFEAENDPVMQEVPAQVAAAARAKSLKVASLALGRATSVNVLNYLSCPKLKGVFYDGHSTPGLLYTFDGTIRAADIGRLLRFRKKVTHIWVACKAFEDPMMSAMIAKAEAQKYAAGKNDILIGPSDRAAGCAMTAALDGKPMTAAFQECYLKHDVQDDKWGFEGSGSDLFGQ